MFIMQYILKCWCAFYLFWSIRSIVPNRIMFTSNTICTATTSDIIKKTPPKPITKSIKKVPKFCAKFIFKYYINVVCVPFAIPIALQSWEIAYFGCARINNFFGKCIKNVLMYWQFGVNVVCVYACVCVFVKTIGNIFSIDVYTFFHLILTEKSNGFFFFSPFGWTNKTEKECIQTKLMLNFQISNNSHGWSRYSECTSDDACWTGKCIRLWVN